MEIIKIILITDKCNMEIIIMAVTLDNMQILMLVKEWIKEEFLIIIGVLFYLIYI